MRGRIRCPRCRKTTSPRTGTCATCGAAVVHPNAGRTSRRTASLVLATLAAFTLIAALAVTYSSRYLPVVADWYVETAIPYATGDRLLPPADEEPYLACARQVVRRLRNEESTAIFPPLSQAKVIPLGGNGLVIHAHVDEDLGNGHLRRSTFSCTVRLTEDGWRVEQVEVGAPIRPKYPDGNWRIAGIAGDRAVRSPVLPGTA